LLLFYEGFDRDEGFGGMDCRPHCGQGKGGGELETQWHLDSLLFGRTVPVAGKALSLCVSASLNLVVLQTKDILCPRSKLHI
jgi:hypothetical protein